jgi:hypothetical protein
MWAAYSHKKRSFTHSDETNSVMNDGPRKPKFLRGLLGNFPQLVLCHFPVRFVFNSINLSPVFGATNDPPKINCCAGGRLEIDGRRLKRRFGY